jgi:hypothetical protein
MANYFVEHIYTHICMHIHRLLHYIIWYRQLGSLCDCTREAANPTLFICNAVHANLPFILHGYIKVNFLTFMKLMGQY